MVSQGPFRAVGLCWLLQFNLDVSLAGYISSGDQNAVGLDSSRSIRTQQELTAFWLWNIYGPERWIAEIDPIPGFS